MAKKSTWREQADAILEMVGPKGTVAADFLATALKKLDAALDDLKAAEIMLERARYNSLRGEALLHEIQILARRVAEFPLDDDKKT